MHRRCAITMKKENLKLFKKLFLLLGFFITLISAITINVEARDFGEGKGGSPTYSDWGHWLVNEDTSSNPKAFERFLDAQVRVRSDYTRDGLKRLINQMGSGAKLPNGTTETLVNTCNRSQYVWWYGEAIGNDRRWPKDYWYTKGDGTHNVPARHWQSMSDDARGSLRAYKAQSSGWTNGKIVLICSASYTPPPPVEVPITIKAKSGTFTYDGNSKTVSGYNITAGDLKSGHEVSVSASRTAIDVGSYPVPVSSVKMTDSNGKDVTSEYKITTREGTLRINPVPTIPEGDDYRCATPRKDTASAIVETATTGSHGYTPNGVGNLRTIETVRATGANRYKSSFHRVDNLSKWNSSKRNFEGASNSSTPEIDLESGGVTGLLSTHGGVYNVLKTLRRDTYTIDHCQPQTREKRNRSRTEYSEEITKHPDGTETTTKVEHIIYYQAWSEWEDSGERIVEVSGPVRTEEYSNYQILSVNCNLDGFNSVKNSTGGDVIAIGNGDGSAALQTPSKSGRTTGNLGKSGVTANSSFYTDGKSCDIFTCTVAPNASVLNDAKNNKGNTNLFGEVLEGDKVGETNDDGELVFFRDNEDRQVRADLWYPKATGLADLDANFGEPAKETFVKVYDDKTSGHVNPTPEIELTTIAPWNKPESYEVGLADIGRVKKYSGEVNRFNIKSQWASEDGAPYQLGVNWEYKGTAWNRIPTKVNGDRITNIKNYPRSFDIHCEFRNNSSEYKATIPDRPYAKGGLNESDTTWTPSNAIRTLFSRSASAMD